MDEDKFPNIFSLSDYSLIHIFKYVSASDLYNLSKTCRRFEGLVKEKKLWYKIDARGVPYNKEKVKYCIERINDRTTDFLTCSDQRHIQIIPDDFFSSDASSKLTVLALENQMIRGDLAKLSQYPKTLVELSFRKSFINSHSAFFKLSYMQMENLQVLILDECGWFETYMIVQISKYPKLEVVSMYKCKKLSDNDIAYLSMAGCFGFKALRIMDVRFTGLGDQILKAFYKHPTLQELYFQSYVSTFALDSYQRRFEIAHGSAMKSNAYLSEYDDIPDMQLDTMRNYFGNHCYRTCRRQNLTNHGTVMYKFVTPAVDNDYEVDSVLYKSPYGECTCSYGDKYNKNSTNEKDSFEDAMCDWEEILRLKSIITDEKAKINTPYIYVLAPKLHMNPFKNKVNISFYEEASESNKHIDWINVREPQNLFEIVMYEHTDIHTLQSEIILPTDTLSFIEPRNNNQNNRSDDSDDEDQRDGGGGRKLSVAGRVLSLDDGDVIVEEVYEIARNEEYRRYDRDYQRNIRIQRENQQEINGSSENDNNIRSAKTVNQNLKKLDGSSSSCATKDHTYCKYKENDSKEKIVVNDSTAHASTSSKEESANGNVSKGNSSKVNINGNVSIGTGNDTSNINSSQENKNSIGDSQNVPTENLNNDSPNKSNKCNICGNVETTPDDNICKACKNKNAEPINPSTSTANSSIDQNKKNCDSNEDPAFISSEFLKAIPSTSRDSPSTSGTHKRKRDSSTNTPKPKKIKTRREAKVFGPGVNIPLFGERVPTDPPNNAFYIRIKMPERNRVEPDLINVPMGGGLINILLDVDNKTKVAIKKLSLRGFPKVTDCTLEYLTNLKLELLDITKTGISRAAVQHFIKQNPTCRVIHESACTCLPSMHF